MLAGDAELFEPQRAGLEEPLEVPANGFLNLRGVSLDALPHAVQELHHAHLGCDSGILNSNQQNGLGKATQDDLRRRWRGVTLVGLGVDGSRRNSGAGEEEAARVRCTHESHGMGVRGFERKRSRLGGLDGAEVFGRREVEGPLRKGRCGWKTDPWAAAEELWGRLGLLRDGNLSNFFAASGGLSFAQ
jgi:hypothetical protein